ncbi:hypothetical protein Tco_0379469 [Tanacetum coccineum]
MSHTLHPQVLRPQEESSGALTFYTSALTNRAIFLQFLAQTQKNNKIKASTQRNEGIFTYSIRASVHLYRSGNFLHGGPDRGCGGQAQLKKTDMLVEMVDMTKRSPIGIVENVLVKIDKFLFPSDFVVMICLKGHYVLEKHYDSIGRISTWPVLATFIA